MSVYDVWILSCLCVCISVWGWYDISKNGHDSCTILWFALCQHNWNWQAAFSNGARCTSTSKPKSTTWVWASWPMVAWPFLLADMRTIDQKSHGLPCLVSRVATNQIYWCLMNECLIFLFQLQPSLFRTSSLLNRRSGVSPSGSSTIWLETGVHSKPSQPPWFHQLVSRQTWVACHWLLRSLGNLNQWWSHLWEQVSSWRSNKYNQSSQLSKLRSLCQVLVRERAGGSSKLTIVLLWLLGCFPLPPNKRRLSWLHLWWWESRCDLKTPLSISSSWLQCLTRMRPSTSHMSARLQLMSWRWQQCVPTSQNANRGNMRMMMRQKRKHAVESPNEVWNKMNLNHRGHRDRDPKLHEQVMNQKIMKRSCSVWTSELHPNFWSFSHWSVTATSSGRQRTSVSLWSLFRKSVSWLFHTSLLISIVSFFFGSKNLIWTNLRISGMGAAQRTRSQRWYEKEKDPAKTIESKLDALEAVFEFVAMTYKRFWKEEPDFDSSYTPPARSDLKEALAKMEERLAWSAVERRGGFMSQPPLTFNSFIALNIPTHVFVIIGRLWWSNGRVFSIQLNRMLLRWFWVKLTFTPTTWPLPTDPLSVWKYVYWKMPENAVQKSWGCVLVMCCFVSFQHGPQIG